MRVLPHSREAEVGVIGSVLLDPPRMNVLSDLKADDFYDDKNVLLWTALNDMKVSGKLIDAVSVVETLKSKDWLNRVGGVEYLLECQEANIIPNYCQSYKEIVIEKSYLRKEIKIYSNGIEKSYEGDSSGADVMSNLAGISIDEQEDKTLYEHAKTYIQDCKEGNVGHFNWFTPEWDNMLGKMSSELALWHAPRSTGKTALMLQTIVQAHIKNQRVPLASIEMLKKELAPRLLANVGNLNTLWMRTRGKITADEEERAKKAAEDLKVLNLCVRDQAMTMEEIRSWAIIEHSKGADAIFIDNLLTITPDKTYENKTVMYDAFIRQFKDLRDILKIPVIILCHPNQEGKVAYSSSCENYADQILFLAEVKEEGLAFRGGGRIEQRTDLNCHIIAHFQKNRQGCNPIATLDFDKQTQTFRHVCWED